MNGIVVVFGMALVLVGAIITFNPYGVFSSAEASSTGQAAANLTSHLGIQPPQNNQQTTDVGFMVVLIGVLLAIIGLVI